MPTARLKRSSPSNPLAIAQTSQGMKTSASRHSAISNSPSTPAAELAKLCASSPVSMRLANIGTKAVLNAPSAKKRRNMLGRAKAIRNASATGPAPRNAAIITSRMNPSRRLSKVQPPTVTKAPNILIGFTLSPRARHQLLRAAAFQPVCGGFRNAACARTGLSHRNYRPPARQTWR